MLNGEPASGDAHELADLVALIKDKALFARLETVRLISIAKTGHYASGFSCAEILATLYYGVMRLRHGEPDWPHRDRFLFGKGHAAATLYPLLADWGFFEATELDDYTRLGSPFGDHPDMTKIPGVDFSSGSLGHALSVGTGMATGLRQQMEHTPNVYVLLGDGELHEGQVWEAALFAAHHNLSNLIAVVDRNQYSLDGHIDDVTTIEPLKDKWEAFGWNVHEVDGHDVAELLETFHAISDHANRGPTVVIAHTVKGKGISYMESEFGWHLGWLAERDEARAVDELRSNR